MCFFCRRLNLSFVNVFLKLFFLNILKTDSRVEKLISAKKHEGLRVVGLSCRD